MKKIYLFLILFIILFINLKLIASNHEILIGQSLDLSENFKIYGQAIRSGILACFNAINNSGGINGKKINLISLDDKGVPKETEKNIFKLLNEKKIDLFLGNMGTRNVLSILPLIKDKTIALFFPWAGNELLRDPNLTNIINGPGLTNTQIEAIIDYIINTFRFKKIAIFHADSDFSIDDANYAEKYLQKFNIKPAAVVSYNRFTMHLQNAVNDLIKADPKVIICLSTDKPSVKLINNFFDLGYFGTMFIGLDSNSLVNTILKNKGVKFYYTTSVPDYKDLNIKIAKEYQENFKKYFPNEPLSNLSFTYYICAKILTLALKETNSLDKQKLINFLENLKNYNLEDFNINFDEKNRHLFGQTIQIIK